MNLPNFWYGSCSYGVLLENHTLYAGKILVWRNFGHFKVKNSQFLVFLTYNIQMLLWILQFSGLEVVLVVFLVFFPFFSFFFSVSALFRGTNHTSSCLFINSLSSVRTSVRGYVSSGPTALTVWYFFLIFCTKLCLHMT